jgi:hypothetical protein
MFTMKSDVLRDTSVVFLHIFVSDRRVAAFVGGFQQSAAGKFPRNVDKSRQSHVRHLVACLGGLIDRCEGPHLFLV